MIKLSGYRSILTLIHYFVKHNQTVSDIFLATLMVWRLLKRCFVTAPETLRSDTLQEQTWQIILTGLLP